MSEKTIHIITAAYNRKEITKRFVDTLNNQSYKNIHLILVDDNSTDGTASMVKNKFENSTVINGDGNLWWGGCLHEAYKWVKENLSSRLDDYVLFSNDDVNYDPKYIEKGINILKDCSKTLVCGTGKDITTGEIVDTVYKRSFEKQENYTEGSLVRAEMGIGDCSSTRSLFFRVKDFMIIGGFHPILLPHYGSDYEWTIRASNKGYRIITHSDVCYTFDIDTTGYNTYDVLSVGKIFSKKSVTNPIYRFNYIFMTTPKKYLFKEIRYQIKRYFNKKHVIKNVIRKSITLKKRN